MTAVSYFGLIRWLAACIAAAGPGAAPAAGPRAPDGGAAGRPGGAEAVLESSRHALVVLDREGRVVFVNHRATALAGRAREDLLGACPWRRGGDDDAVPGTAGAAAVPPGLVTRFLAGGRWLEARAHPVERGGLAVQIVEAPVAPPAAAAPDAVARAGRQQAIAAELAQQALAGADLEVLAAAAARRVADGLGVELVGVFELAPDPASLSLAAGVGWRDGTRRRARLTTAGWSPAACALATLVPVAAPDLGAVEPRVVVPFPLWDHGAVSVLDVAVRDRGAPLGVLEAASLTPRAYSPDDARFLQAVARVLGAAAERKAAEARVQSQALRDALTGLPNRILLREQIERGLARARRSGETLALLALDLDRFKPVNDTLGHAAGDRLLAEAARRLRACVRESDTVARLGGDEFALLLGGLRAAADAAAVARKVLDALAEPFAVDGRLVHIGASIGIAVYPADGADHDALLRNADVALYRAKARTRNTYRFYTPRMAARVERRRALERDLRQALDRSGLELHYQPRVDLAADRITGVEALLRWRHPERGPLMPAAFLDVAEASDLFVPLERWVLHRACAQARAWRDAGAPPITVAVNLSSAQCRRPDLAATVEEALAAAGLEPRGLRLEVGESVFDAGAEEVQPAALGRLRRQGVGIAIEGFGAAATHFGRLRRLPVDEVKLHPGLVAALGDDAEAEIVARAAIGLGRALGLRVAATGVETAAQLDFLRAEGCAVAQGYHLARPLPPEACAALLFDGRIPPPHREPAAAIPA